MNKNIISIILAVTSLFLHIAYRVVSTFYPDYIIHSFLYIYSTALVFSIISLIIAFINKNNTNLLVKIISLIAFFVSLSIFFNKEIKIDFNY